MPHLVNCDEATLKHLRELKPKRNNDTDGPKKIKYASEDAINGSKDRALSLKQRLKINGPEVPVPLPAPTGQDLAAAGGADSDGDATIFYSFLADKQDGELEKAAVHGEDEPASVSVADQAEESVLEADGDDEGESKNKNVGAKPQDPLGLDKLGYTKEQVDGWLAQGYSVADIKNGVAASGEKNTEVTNKLSSEIAAA
ncbi:MAG: hypothetical protein EBR67_04140 [Proteobacteria bacterium]|nr:hypothetical protein [Pseudomonadota bacterium]